VSWAKLRREIYDRDGGMCQACGMPVGKRWDCGHVVDRIVGGSDTLDNLKLMCIRCNRTLKPITPTRGEAQRWMDSQHTLNPVNWSPVWELIRGQKASIDEQAPLAEH
jgi:5-methylcytosine-specific restriction endonuclease McrA